MLDTCRVCEMQRVRTSLLQGVDDGVKTIYSPPPSRNRLQEPRSEPQDFIVKSRNVIRTHRPLQGLVTFVPSFAAVTMHGASPTGYCLDRSEGPLNPGEGGA